MIQINEAYLHILDAIHDTKILSEKEMALDNEIFDYVDKHIEGFFDQIDVAKTEIRDESKIALILEESKSAGFKDFTLAVADLFFEAMRKTEEIKSSDLLFVHFEREGTSYLGVLKLNFRTSYAHFVEIEDRVITNKIIRQLTTLPYKSQRVEEGFLIDLTDLTAFIKDKVVTIDGNKTKYITEEVLGLSVQMTPKRALDVIAKTAEKVLQKYDDTSYVKAAKVRKMINEQIDEQGQVDLESIVKQCFETTVEREEYQSALDQKGVVATDAMFNETQKKKLKRTQRIKTASGVELILPYEYVSRSENLEIENHPDGSTSIQLKNLGEIL